MENKTNNRFTPEIICTSKRNFNIPIYQRLFEWEKDNIEQLLNDMWFEYDRNTSNPGPYYIGMLTLYGDDLVDGQQRFTVLSIIASVFKKFYKPWAQMKGKLHLKARTDDEKFLSSLFDEKERTDYINKKMQNGKEAVKNWVDNNKKLQESNKEDFAKYVYEKCTFFMATLPENYKPSDLNKYFEAMNSTGKNLESHEIIKVEKYLKSIKDNQPFYNQIWNLVSDMDKLLVRYKTEGKKKESEDELRERYKELLLNFDSFIEKKSFIFKNKIELLNDFHEDEEQNSDFQTISELEPDGHNPDVRRQDKYFGDGYHSALNFPEFLLQILYITFSEETRNKVNVNEFFDVHALQKTFKEYTKDWDDSNWKKFGEDLLRYRIIYDYYVLRVPNSEFNPYDLEFSVQDTETDSNMIKQLQSMLYVDSSSKTYYRWIVPLLDFLNKKHDVTATQIFKELQRIDNAIKEHSENILNNEEDISFGGRYTVYFLRRLDFYLWLDNHKLCSQEIDPVINNYKFKRSYNSQEHLHPQNDEHREGYEPWGDKKHEFGNIFLISSSFNSTQNDDTINTKFGRILDQISSNSIESIKLYKILEFCKEDEKTGAVTEMAKRWTIEKMEKHQEEMLQRLRDSYKESK